MATKQLTLFPSKSIAAGATGVPSKVIEVVKGQRLAVDVTATNPASPALSSPLEWQIEHSPDGETGWEAEGGAQPMTSTAEDVKTWRNWVLSKEGFYRLTAGGNVGAAVVIDAKATPYNG